MIPAIFAGAQTAGLVGLIAAAQAIRIRAVVTRDVAFALVAERLGYPVVETIRAAPMADAALLLSVHGREIIPAETLDGLTYGAVNVHPCLWKYPGADPIGRWLAAGERRASVGAHVMTAEVDAGPVICEAFRVLPACETREEVYRWLYPVYGFVVRRALDQILAAHYGVFNPFGITDEPPFVESLIAREALA